MKGPLIALVVGAMLTVSACSSSTESAESSKSPAKPTSTSSATPAVAPTTAIPVNEMPTAVPAAPEPCAANRKAKAVLVRLSKQHLWFCARDKVVRDSPITSGMEGQYTETPTGRYTIQSRNRNTSLTLNTGETFTVKYWIPFDAPLFGFHDSSWQDFPYGSAKYKKHGSHGCVHLPLKTIKFLYGWADVGTSVRIRA